MSPSTDALRDRSSQWLAHALLVAAIALPVLVVVALWQSPPSAWPGARDPAPALRRAAGALALVPALCMSVGLWRARDCFTSFARGEHFNAVTVSSLRACARAMVAAGLAGLVVPSLIGLLLSGGQRLTVDVGSGQVALLVFGALVWKVASAFARGITLAEENAQFV